MNIALANNISMTSREIAELVGSRPDNVRVTIEKLAERSVITLPQTQVKPTGGRPSIEYVFSGEQGKRDSIIVVAQLCPEFTARLVDRWRELEAERARPKSQAELIAEMAMLNLEQERRLNHVEEQVSSVSETVDQIKRGTIPAGWVGFSLLRTKTGLSDAKCRTLAKAFSVPVDTITILTPDGQPRPMKIVQELKFLEAFRLVMSQAERRNIRWHHPALGLFQVLGHE